MPAKYRKIRLATNPRKRNAARPKKRNVSRPKHVKAKRRKKSNPLLAFYGPVTGGPMKKRKKNPSTGSRKRPRRRNPSVRGVASRSLSLVKLGAAALGGMILTRQIPQMILKEKNQGIVGYAANALVAGLVSVAGAKFAGKEVGFAAGVGGGLYTVQRVLDENTTNLGKALTMAGVGDARACGTLKGIRPAQLTNVPRDRNGFVVPQPWIRETAREEVSRLLPTAGTGRMAGRRAAYAA